MTTPTRREFLARCSALAVSAAFASPQILAAAPTLRDIALDRISLADFANLQGATFLVRAAGRAVGLKLVAVDSASVGPEASGGELEEHFSLLFAGPPQAPIAQDTHRFEQPTLGRFAMFIVPIGCVDPALCLYEAVFHRPFNRQPSPVASKAPRRNPSRPQIHVY